ncbi:MAG: esterase family protein [Rubrobacter sp.]|nr:esterase family protein [Rubrobacter sp.]
MEKGFRARRHRWKRLIFVLIMLAAQASLGVGVFVGYSYWEYRTFWGDPNASPSDVTSFGTVETKTFYSEALGQTMEYEIYLPPGYDDLWHRFMHYPVVYLLHGVPGTDDDWVSKGGAADAMDTLLARKQVQPMLVVIPTGANARWGPETGWVDGSQGDWGTYTTKDLVSEVDSNYRTVASADGRAIAGNSEGGWAAVNLGLKNPSKFGVVGSFSGYFTADDQDKNNLFDGDQSLADANSPTSYLPRLGGDLPAIYLLQEQDRGGRFQQDFEENQEFAEELKARGATYEFDNPSGGDHNWDFWRAYLPDFLIFTSEHLR